MYKLTGGSPLRLARGYDDGRLCYSYTLSFSLRAILTAETKTSMIF